MKIRTAIAIGLLLSIVALFTYIVVRGLGGTDALFLIIGHLVAWGEMVVIFYFRKKPRSEE